MEQNTQVVTISRQAGSGGSYIGSELAKELGFFYGDREILRRAADILNRDVTTLEDYDEKSSGFIKNVLRIFSIGSPEFVFATKELPIYDSDVFALERKIIQKIVEQSNAVIIGRGGFHLLRDRPCTVHLFFHANKEFRMERLQKTDNTLNLKDARERIIESDRRRERFMRDLVNTDWMDAKNYHLCIDTSVVGISESLRIASNFVKKTLKLA